MDGETRLIQVRSFAVISTPLSERLHAMHAADAAWFCIRSRQKQEHIAAAHLRQLPDVEVFDPRLKILRFTRRGKVILTEPLFPNYLFARFVPDAVLDRVRYAAGVHTVLRFGDRIPTIPHEVIESLQSSLATVAAEIFREGPVEGDEVEITRGLFQGENALVTRVFPARRRVQVLLEVLGRSTAMELSLDCIFCQPQSRGNRVFISP